MIARLYNALLPVLCLVLVNGTGCKKETLPSTTTQIKRPASLVATLTLPRGNDFSELVSRINELGVPGAMVGVGAASGVISLLGMFAENSADLQADQPMRLLLVGKPTGPDNIPAILLAKAREGATVKPANDSLEVVQLGGLTMIGRKAKIKEYRAYVEFLGTTKFAPEPVAQIYPAALHKTFKDEIAQGFDTMMSQAASQGNGQVDLTKVLAIYSRVGKAIVEQAEWIEVRVGPQERSILEIASKPKANTVFDEFAKIQAPHAFDLAKHVPAGNAPRFYMEGHIPFGPLYDPMLDWVMEFMPELGSDYRDAFAEFAKLWDGRMFMAMDMDITGLASGQPTFTAFMAASTKESSASLMNKLWSSFEGKELDTAGVKQRFEYKKRAPIDGTDVHELITTMQVPNGTGDVIETKQRMVSVALDNWWAMSQSMGDPPSELAPLIKSLKSKGGASALSERATAALKWAKTNKESMLFWVDLSKIVPDSVPVSEVRLTYGVRDDSGSREIVMGIDAR